MDDVGDGRGTQIHRKLWKPDADFAVCSFWPCPASIETLQWWIYGDRAIWLFSSVHVQMHIVVMHEREACHCSQRVKILYFIGTSAMELHTNMKGITSFVNEARRLYLGILSPVYQIYLCINQIRNSWCTHVIKVYIKVTDSTRLWASYREIWYTNAVFMRSSIDKSFLPQVYTKKVGKEKILIIQTSSSKSSIFIFLMEFSHIWSMLLSTIYRLCECQNWHKMYFCFEKPGLTTL